MKNLFSLSFFAIIIFISGCEKTENISSPEWNSFTNRFIDNYFEFNPTFAVYMGRHEFDGRLADLSKENIQKQISWLHQIKDSAMLFDSTSLNGAQKYERNYLLSFVNRDLFWLEDAEQPFNNPAAYSGSMDPSVYLTLDYAPLIERMKAYIAYAKGVPKFIEQMKANLELPLPKAFAEYGKNSFLGYAEYFKKDVPPIFSSIKDEKLLSDFESANKKAAEASLEAGNWFKELTKTKNNSFALGADLFKEMLLKTEDVDISLDELQKIGESNLNENFNALKKACEQFAPGKSIKECISIIKSNKPENGPVEFARTQLPVLKNFILRKNIVSIPGNEEAKVDTAPPYNSQNFAYINIPGPYEKNLPSTYYIALPNPDWTRAQREAYTLCKEELSIVTSHEVWPGHFLQFLFQNQGNSILQKIFWDYAFTEGWAHYAEQMMVDEGLGNSAPDMKIAQLLQALWRNVRFVSAIGLHTGKMTVEESEKMFQEKAFLDFGNAKQQALRGTYDPAYLNYTMGKLMILKLRKDWMKENPGKTLKDFHDKFLSYGAPPIPLIRKAMLGNKDDGKLF